MSTLNKKLFLVPAAVVALAVATVVYSQTQAVDQTCEVPLNSNTTVSYSKENTSHQLQLTSYHEPYNDIWGVLLSYQGDGQFVNESSLDPNIFFSRPVKFGDFAINLKKERSLTVSYPDGGICKVSKMIDDVALTGKTEAVSSPTPAPTSRASNQNATCRVPLNHQARASFTDREGYHEVLFVSYDNNPKDRGVMIYYQVGDMRDYDSSHEPEKLLKEPKPYAGITIGMEDPKTFFLRYPDTGTCKVEPSH